MPYFYHVQFLISTPPWSTPVSLQMIIWGRERDNLLDHGRPTTILPLKKTNSIFPISFQLPVATQMGCCFVPSSCFHSSNLFDLSLYSSFAHCHSSHEFMCAAVLLYQEKNFFVVIHHLWLLQSFIPGIWKKRIWYECLIFS